jgi:hypothetical protein
VVEEDRSCLVSVTSHARHIAKPAIVSSPAAMQSDGGLHCGTKSQPWLLEAPAGQRINISLLDFASKSAANAADSTADSSLSRDTSDRQRGVVSSTGCAQSPGRQHYGYVIDKSATGNKKNVSICGGENSSDRMRNVFLSSSNVVELVLFAGEQNTARSRRNSYLLKIEGRLIVSCTNLLMLILICSLHSWRNSDG